MSEETQKQIEALTAQLTPRGAFEACYFGTKTEEGKRFCEAYAAIRELEGHQVTVVFKQ